MTTGVLLPTAAFVPSPSSKSLKGHQRQLSQPPPTPTLQSAVLHVFRLVRRSVVLQLLLAALVIGSLAKGILYPSDPPGILDSRGRSSWKTEKGVLDVGDGSSSTAQPAKIPAALHDKGEIGVPVGWDSDGVYRVLTPDASSSSTTAQGLSVLGLVADQAFHLLAPDSSVEYWQTLEAFVRGSFAPGQLRDSLLASLAAHQDDAPLPDPRKGVTSFKKIWQTDKADARSDSGGWVEKNSGWDWSLLDDDEADAWVRKALGVSGGGGSGEEANRVEECGVVKIWDEVLKSGKGGILRSDMLRYLLLLVEGGVYSDTDTNCLKSIDQWGRNGRDHNADYPRTHADAKVIVGIEADVGTREDWNEWWPRPLQFVQWTIAAAPHHPIFVDVVRRISESTTAASSWLSARESLAVRLRGEGKEVDAVRVEALDLFEVKGHEGEYEKMLGKGVSVMEWTGPGVWSDSVLSYLRAAYGLSWPAFKDLHRPLRVGEVSILPVTGFSPGVGLFGSQATWDAEAMVEHKFRGSWKGGH